MNKISEASCSHHDDVWKSGNYTVNVLLQTSNEAVALLNHGDLQGAYQRMYFCLGMMKALASDEISVLRGQAFCKHVLVAPPPIVEALKTKEADTDGMSSRYVFARPIVVMANTQNQGQPSLNSYKLVSIVLFNMALTNHFLALKNLQDQPGDCAHSRSLMRTSLHLYQLCRESMDCVEFSEASLTIAVMNNMTEVCKMMHALATKAVVFENTIHLHFSHMELHEWADSAKSCSEWLVQTFMYYSIQGGDRAHGLVDLLGDVLANAMATLSDGPVAAVAA